MHHCLVLDQHLYCDECGTQYKECFWCATLTPEDHTHCKSCAAPL